MSGVPVTFGDEGLGVFPFTFKISAAGAVKRTAGFSVFTKDHVAPAVTRAVKAEVDRLSNRKCPGSTRYDPARYVAIGGKKVTVTGGCDLAFENLWDKLAEAINLH